MSGRYRDHDPAFYRSLAEARIRTAMYQSRHARRKAFLRWLLSREVRIAIAAILAGLVIAFSAFAEGSKHTKGDNRRSFQGGRQSCVPRGCGAAAGLYSKPVGLAFFGSSAGSPVQDRAPAPALSPNHATAGKTAAVAPRPGHRGALSFADQAPRGSAQVPLARGLDFRSASEAGRFGPAVPDAVTDPGWREISPGTLQIWGGLLLFIGSLALLDYLVSRERAAERKAEGRVIEGHARRTSR